jgi:N-acetyl-gamma-glutamylphosphate reductase
LPELNKPIRNAEYIANPGCFTAIQLALLPLLGLLLRPMSISMLQREVLAQESAHDDTFQLEIK